MLFQFGEYEDGVDGNSLWSEGDWNCDGDFSTSDLVYAFQKGSYTAEAKRSDSVLAAAAARDRNQVILRR